MRSLRFVAKLENNTLNDLLVKIFQCRSKDDTQKI